jgi:hypothetical protein
MKHLIPRIGVDAAVGAGKSFAHGLFGAEFFG